MTYDEWKARDVLAEQNDESPPDEEIAVDSTYDEWKARDVQAKGIAVDSVRRLGANVTHNTAMDERRLIADWLVDKGFAGLAIRVLAGEHER